MISVSVGARRRSSVSQPSGTPHQQQQALERRRRQSRLISVGELAMTSLEKFVFVDDYRSDKIWNPDEKRLTLAYEGLTDIPRSIIEEHGRKAEILDVTRNKLAHSDFLHDFDNLTTLIMDHNYITDDVTFPHMPLVTTLWLNHNLVEHLHPFLQNLRKSFPNLRMLSLMGNNGAPSYLNGGSYYEFLQYRLFVVSWLPKLEYLDDRPVTLDQREEASRLYGKSFYQNLVHAPLQECLQQLQDKFRTVSSSWFGERDSFVPNRVI